MKPVSDKGSVIDTILECTDDHGRSYNLSLPCIETMIGRYFSVDFQAGCDYSLNHFNTDGIKSRRMFEVGAECF